VVEQSNAMKNPANFKACFEITPTRARTPKQKSRYNCARMSSESLSLRHEEVLKSLDLRAFSLFFSLFVVNRVVIAPYLAPYFDPYRLVRIARVKRKKQRGCRKSCMSRNVRHTNRNICLLSGVSMLDAILF
jgi:hypothetical protein